MKHQGKVTRALRQRIYSLKEAGKSLRESEAVLASEGVEVSRQTISTILRERTAKEGAGANAGGAGDGGGTGPGAEQGGDAGTAAGGSWGATGAPIELPPDADLAMRVLWAKLQDIRGRIAALPNDGEHSTATAFAALTRVELATITKLQEAMPKPKPDPALDPNNIAARAMVHQHVVSTIESVKARARGLGYRFPGDEEER